MSESSSAEWPGYAGVIASVHKTLNSQKIKLNAENNTARRRSVVNARRRSKPLNKIVCIVTDTTHLQESIGNHDAVCCASSAVRPISASECLSKRVRQ